MKIKLLFICLIFSGGIMAQAKLSYLFADYLEGKFKTCDSLTMEERSGGKRFLYGGANYKPFVNDKKLMSELRNKVMFIELNDSLFINCRKLLCNQRLVGDWYASCLLIKNRIFFSAPPSDGSVMKSAFAFGIIGAAISAGVSANNSWIYMLSDDSKEVKRVKKAHVLFLLSEYEDMKRAYDKEEKPDDSDTIEKYLIALYNQTRVKKNLDSQATDESM